MHTYVHSDFAIHLAKPIRQIENLRQLLKKNGRVIARGASLIPPPFKAETETEILLLTMRFSGNAVYTPTAETIKWLLDSYNDTKIRSSLDYTRMSDIVEPDEPIGFRWVGFDPFGVVFEPEQDFRADVFIGNVPEHLPQLELYKYNRELSTLAGIEAFAALHLLPRLTREAWRGATVVLPRVQAADDHPGSEAGALWFVQTEDRLRVSATRWTYGYYGHKLIIPTIRELT